MEITKELFLSICNSYCLSLTELCKLENRLSEALGPGNQISLTDSIFKPLDTMLLNFLEACKVSDVEIEWFIANYEGISKGEPAAIYIRKTEEDEEYWMYFAIKSFDDYWNYLIHERDADSFLPIETFKTKDSKVYALGGVFKSE